jgi:hypothetical protein
MRFRRTGAVSLLICTNGAEAADAVTFRRDGHIAERIDACRSYRAS